MQGGSPLYEGQGNRAQSEASSNMTPVFTRSQLINELSPIREAAHESSKAVSNDVARVSTDDLMKLKPT